MFNMKVNVVKTDSKVIFKIMIPVFLYLIITTLFFPLVAIISFIPVTIFFIKRGMKISNQYTIQKNVSFSVKAGNIFMDDQIVKVFKNPLGKRVDIKCYDTTDVVYIEMDKAKDFLQFLKDNNV